MFFRRVYCLDLDKAVQNKAIELRKCHKIKLADNIVLATALYACFAAFKLGRRFAAQFAKEILSAKKH
ncbi:PIN family toxin-antitoxin system [Kingella kingae]|uniref:PIN family toxin-antitoxin system n=1 Tax=Kingella kingae TaxID=504 RepID=UPI001E40D15D|nr:PIN family toxin-antitoxin system [Kingella kingae]